MNKQLLKILLEGFRLHGHYLCHTNGMFSDNILADAAGDEIPFNGETFRKTSHSYHTKFEKLLEALKNETS